MISVLVNVTVNPSLNLPGPVYEYVYGTGGLQSRMPGYTFTVTPAGSIYTIVATKNAAASGELSRVSFKVSYSASYGLQDPPVTVMPVPTFNISPQPVTSIFLQALRQHADVTDQASLIVMLSQITITSTGDGYLVDFLYKGSWYYTLNGNLDWVMAV